MAELVPMLLTALWQLFPAWARLERLEHVLFGFGLAIFLEAEQALF